MARLQHLKRRQADLSSLADGWLPHDGGPCPVDPNSSPAVMYRYGAKVRAGTFPASHWRNSSTGQSWWEWSDQMHDIVAYCPEIPTNEKGAGASQPQPPVDHSGYLSSR